MRSKMRMIYNIVLFYMKLMNSWFPFFASTKRPKTKRPHTKRPKTRRSQTKRRSAKRSTQRAYKMRGG
jgi:hypothetical protein